MHPLIHTRGSCTLDSSLNRTRANNFTIVCLSGYDAFFAVKTKVSFLRACLSLCSCWKSEKECGERNWEEEERKREREKAEAKSPITDFRIIFFTIPAMGVALLRSRFGYPALNSILWARADRREMEINWTPRKERERIIRAENYGKLPGKSIWAASERSTPTPTTSTISPSNCVAENRLLFFSSSLLPPVLGLLNPVES